MTRYPRLVAELDARGLDADTLARLAGIERATVHAIVEDGWPATLSDRARIAAALDLSPAGLFRLDDDLESGLPAGEARFVRDPAVLRVIDQRSA